MAYHPLLQSAAYAPKPYQGMTPQEIIAQAIEQQKSEDAHRAEGIANDESQMTLEENQALHPAVLSQLQQEAQPAAPSSMAAPAQNGTPGASMTGQPSAIPDPYARQQSLLGEQSQLAEYAKNHPVMLAMSQRLKDIQAAKEKSLAERQGIAGTQFTIDQNRAFASLIPDMESVKSQGLAAMKGASPRASIDAYNAMVGSVQSAVASKRPDLLGSKLYQDYMKDLEKYKPTPQPNMATVIQGQQTLKPADLDFLIDQVHARNLAPQDALEKARLLGFNGIEAERQIVEGLKSKYGEDFDITSAARGKKMATNNGVSNYVAAMDNAYSTAQHMKDVLANLHNTDSKTVNNVVQAFKREFNNLDQLRADVVQTTAQEEFGPAVARGSGQVTDKARGIVDRMTPINLNDAGTKATIDEVLQSISRNRKAIEDASYGYIKPRKIGAGSKPPPASGSIVTHKDGTRWKYNGGDPGKPESWEKQ
jgi:hypothetical protein